MEVTHREDKITHAVIGGGESISMGITDDAMFMHMLSSTLYSDKILAVVRESICNAWDAHIEAKRVDRPIEITLTREKLTIKDHGFGIAHDQIGPIYGTYGASTKKHDGKQTGGFGLGCKSPFAYTDHFEVISCHQGIKTVYRMTKSSAELNGKPGIVPLLSIPTDEEGLTMSLDIKNNDDYVRYQSLIKRIVANGEINAELNGNRLPVIEFSQMVNGYVITRADMLENTTSVCMRYGNVIYPLESHATYRNDYNNVVGILEKLSSHYGRFQIVFQAKPNTLSITPSRESLSMEEKTIQTVCTMLKKFLHGHNNRFHRACLDLVMSNNEAFVRKGEAKKLLSSPTSKNLMANSTVARSRQSMLTDTAQAAKQYLSTTYPDHKNFATKDMLNRLTLMIKAKSYDVGLLQSFRSEYRRNSTDIGKHHSRKFTWFRRNIIAPVVVGMKEAGLVPDRLFVFASTSANGGWGYNAETYSRSFVPTTMGGMLSFLRKLVVLTHSQKAINERVRRVENFTAVHGKDEGYLTYIVPRSPKKIEEARAYFGSLPVVLIDLTLEIEKRQSLISNREPKAKKPVGYPTLHSARVKSVFDQDTARYTTMRNEKPLFVTLLNSKSAKHLSRRDLPDCDTGLTDLIYARWKDEGGVVFSDPEKQNAIKKGIPSLRTFLVQQMTALFKDKEVLKYLGVSLDRLLIKSRDKHSTQTDDAIKIIRDNPAIFEKLKLGVTLSPEKMQLLAMWPFIQGWTANETNRETLKAIPLNKKILTIGEKIHTSKTIPLLNLDVIAEMLLIGDAESKTHATDVFLKAIKG